MKELNCRSPKLLPCYDFFFLKNVFLHFGYYFEFCYDIFASNFCTFGIPSHKFLAPPLAAPHSILTTPYKAKHNLDGEQSQPLKAHQAAHHKFLHHAGTPKHRGRRRPFHSRNPDLEHEIPDPDRKLVRPTGVHLIRSPPVPSEQRNPQQQAKIQRNCESNSYIDHGDVRGTEDKGREG